MITTYRERVEVQGEVLLSAHAGGNEEGDLYVVAGFEWDRPWDAGDSVPPIAPRLRLPYYLVRVAPEKPGVAWRILPEIEETIWDATGWFVSPLVQSNVVRLPSGTEAERFRTLVAEVGLDPLNVADSLGAITGVSRDDAVWLLAGRGWVGWAPPRWRKVNTLLRYAGFAATTRPEEEVVEGDLAIEERPW